MERPNDIPEDVWNTAYDASFVGYWLVVEKVARAILDERENCALIAEARTPLYSGLEGKNACREIANSIRDVTDAPTHHEIRDLSSFVAERNAGKE